MVKHIGSFIRQYIMSTQLDDAFSRMDTSTPRGIQEKRLTSVCTSHYNLKGVFSANQVDVNKSPTRAINQEHPVNVESCAEFAGKVSSGSWICEQVYEFPIVCQSKSSNYMQI